MVNFPTQFKTHNQLVTFLKRFLWYNVLHTAVNYASPEFRPTSPVKLYEEKGGLPLNLFESLPDAYHSIVSFNSYIQFNSFVFNLSKVS